MTRIAAGRRELGGPHLAPRQEPQYRLATVLGDYWYHRPEHIPSAALVDMLALFGVAEGTTRQAMRRLVGRGILVTSKNGRNTNYGFPRRTPEQIQARIHELIGRPSSPPWDQRWTIATFSVPEKQRDVRRSLRTRLTALGFGLLQDAVWISPRDQVEEAQAVFDRYGVENAHVFRGRHRVRSGHETPLTDAFNLDEIRDDYLTFIARHTDVNPDVENPLVARTLLMFDWQSLRLTDPRLPESLLPDDWPRDAAYDVFAKVYTALGPPAEEQFRSILARHDEELAPWAAHHIP